MKVYILLDVGDSDNIVKVCSDLAQAKYEIKYNFPGKKIDIEIHEVDA